MGSLHTDSWGSLRTGGERGAGGLRGGAWFSLQCILELPVASQWPALPQLRKLLILKTELGEPLKVKNDYSLVPLRKFLY